MADESSADDAPITFNIKSSNDTKYTITVSLSSTVAELKEKLATKEFADIPVERQRLIYSGRVLKDEDTLATYKIQAGNTVHLVKGAASNLRQNPANQGSSVPAALPANLNSGVGNNPLAGLTGARYAGFAQLPNQSMFGPDGGMGPPPDPEDMVRMLQNPQFASTLSEALSNSDLVDSMISSNPMLRDMGPQVRQMLQSPEFRRMMTDPDQLRSMIQMQRMLGGGPFGGGGLGGGGNTAFPAPGITDTTPASQQGTQPQGQASGAAAPPTPFNPYAAFAQGQAGGAAGTQPAGSNPFAALFNPAIFGSIPNQNRTSSASVEHGTPANDPNSSSTPSNTSQQQSPFAFPSPMYNPAMIQQFLAAMNQQQQQGSAANPSDPSSSSAAPNNPFAALMNPWLINPAGPSGGIFGTNFSTGPAAGASTAAAAPPPVDTRPPEEIYAVQLGQLNEMGFYEFERNIEALRRTGGNVQGAVEYLLTH